MSEEAQEQKRASGVDKVLAGGVDLLFNGVLVLLYGRRLGETKSERVARWAVVVFVCVGLIAGGVYLGTKGGSKRRSRGASGTGYGRPRSGSPRRSTGGSSRPMPRPPPGPEGRRGPRSGIRGPQGGPPGRRDTPERPPERRPPTRRPPTR